MSDHLQVTIQNAPEIQYPIAFGSTFVNLPDLIATTGERPGKICIVTDSNVAALYLAEVKGILSGFVPEISVFCIQAGEQSKNLESVRALYALLCEEKFARDDLMIALGGGVVGDLAGFAAATYLRGIDVVQVPTTLLAQVDSSVGGKTGVDFAHYKNLVGSFFQPRAVCMNMNSLQTLPKREFLSGLGEVTKTALLAGRTFLDPLFEDAELVLARDPDVLAAVVRRCCAYKAGIVESDPMERLGSRAFLNLGHTVGHAVETCLFPQWPHGLCVAAGLIAAAGLSERRGLLTPEEASLIGNGNTALGLPITIPEIPREQFLDALRSDKKRKSGSLTFVLLAGIGHPVLVDQVTEDEILEVMEGMTDRGEER